MKRPTTKFLPMISRIKGEHCKRVEKCRQELKKILRSSGESSISITELPLKMLSTTSWWKDWQTYRCRVQSYLTSFRKSGVVVNTAIAMACAEGIVRSADSNILAVNWGHILITRDWAKRILGFVARVPTPKSLLRILRRRKSSFYWTSKLLSHKRI